MPKTVSHTSEARCLGLLKVAPAALLVVNRRAEIVFLNARALTLFGYHEDDLVGQMATMLIPQGFAHRLIGGDTLAETDPLAQEIGSAIELVARRRDGSTFPVEIVLSLLQCTEGLLVTAIVRDVTAQRAAQQDLTQMEAKFRGLLEAVPDPLVVVNEAREIVLLNAQAEKQFGYERDELLGRNITTIIPRGFAERMQSDSLVPKDIVLAQQIGTGAELSGRRYDGDEFPIEMMLSTLEAPEGDLVTAVIRDVSVRKRAEQFLDEKITELNRSNKELEQFADVASHDLQEPLRMVASYTQLLARKYKGKLDADADDFIAYAVDGAERMQRLIQDLLTYSRLATKAQELKPTSSEEALTFALRNLDGAIEDSGAIVAYDPLPEVLADGGQLTQLFQNLIGNAIKYHNGEPPRVHVSATMDGPDRWLFSVKDNGMGIEPQYFERIFGMFQRLHKREEYSGTGIGLAICRKIVERHGGSISVESRLHEGSTFKFALKGGHAL